MVRRYTYKKLTSGDYAQCYFCDKFNTHFVLKNNRTGEDFFCCVACSLKFISKRQQRVMLRKYPLILKKEENEEIYSFYFN